jgi:hypothetical protein
LERIKRHTRILPVLCGFETGTVKLREENRLRVFEKRVLRRIENEVTREWKKTT